MSNNPNDQIRGPAAERSVMMRLTLQQTTDLARYQEALRQTRQDLRARLSVAELSAILDVLNGHWFSDASSIAYIAMEVEDAIRLNGLDETWQINGPSLVSLIRQLTYIEACTLADAAERFWQKVGHGDDGRPEEALDG